MWHCHDAYFLLSSFVPVFSLIYLFLYAPLLVLTAFSFTPSEYSVRWEGFTWRWYQAVWQNQPIQEALLVSLTVPIQPC